MDEAHQVTCPRNPLQAEVQYRDGLMIALPGPARPLRLKTSPTLRLASTSANWVTSIGCDLMREK